MENEKRETSEFGKALDALLEGHSNECILDAILGRIPEGDLCQAMLRVFDRQNTVMSPTFPGNAIMCAVGLGSTQVYGASSANINVQPFEAFRLDRLIISSDVARHFLVTDIKVGDKSQLDSPGCIPGLSFTENVFAIKLKGDMVHPRQFITVSVTNQSASGCNFQGVLIGHTDRKPSSGIDCQQKEAA